MSPRIARLICAVEEYLNKGGEHDGPCDNDPNEVGACSHHLVASTRRRYAIIDAIAAIRADDKLA